MSNVVLKNGKEFDLWQKFFGDLHAGKEIEGICVYPIEHRKTPLKGVRFLLVEGEDVTYNFPATQYELIKDHIRRRDYNWLTGRNGIKELQQYSVGPREQHRFGTGPYVFHPHLLRLNRQIYQLPRDVFFGEQNDIDFGDLTSGDFLRADATFMKVPNLLKDVSKQVSANLALIAADPRIKKDHDLIFTYLVDKESLLVQPTLDKVDPLLPEGGQMVLEQKPINIDEWKAYPGLTLTAVSTITGAVTRLNAAITNFLAIGEQHPYLNHYVREIMRAASIHITNAWQTVYNFSVPDGQAQIDEVANQLLTELSALPGEPGLDLNNWETWDYTDRSNPVKVTDVNYYQSIACKYTESFVRALYDYLLGLQNPLFRPYAKITPVAEEDLGEHAIGSIRLGNQ